MLAKKTTNYSRELVRILQQATITTGSLWLTGLGLKRITLKKMVIMITAKQNAAKQNKDNTKKFNFPSKLSIVIVYLMKGVTKVKQFYAYLMTTKAIKGLIQVINIPKTTLKAPSLCSFFQFSLAASTFSTLGILIFLLNLLLFELFIFDLIYFSSERYSSIYTQDILRNAIIYLLSDIFIYHTFYDNCKKLLQSFQFYV